MPVRSCRTLLQPGLLTLLAAACAAANAQTASAPSAALSEVVVSASGFEQELKQAPASISVVTRKELETKNYRDLAEALQGVEGIDVMGGTGKTGGLDISIRGMPSDYTLILIDGRRQNVAGDVTPNGYGAALNSFMPPVSAIERIEVIRGPMSTLYGSDAMGGVVNIITRKVARSGAAKSASRPAFRRTANGATRAARISTSAAR
ncbi:TonB-dependent receptor plug domain-containing protein [Comamonas endophytica]|uniref:TonB-dependent receptor plug domain-containing protein n=1 Tax=Comamonas endophytica TaxID=2949090 RepID=UPI00360D8947